MTSPELKYLAKAIKYRDIGNCRPSCDALYLLGTCADEIGAVIRAAEMFTADKPYSSQQDLDAALDALKAKIKGAMNVQL